jgi:hypothetical protein
VTATARTTSTPALLPPACSTYRHHGFKFSNCDWGSHRALPDLRRLMIWSSVNVSGEWARRAMVVSDRPDLDGAVGGEAA